MLQAKLKKNVASITGLYFGRFARDEEKGFAITVGLAMNNICEIYELLFHHLLECLNSYSAGRGIHH